MNKSFGLLCTQFIFALLGDHVLDGGKNCHPIQAEEAAEESVTFVAPPSLSSFL